MPFLYPFGRYPPDADIVKRVTAAADRLRGLIAETDVSRLDGDEYSKKRFLKGKLRELDHNLTKYAFHVSWILHLADAPPEQVVLIDHGGGTGLQGLLAKAAGVGTVIYNDINERVLSVARSLGEAIELPCNHYVLGDIGPLFDYLDARGIVPSAMVSYDVLEHIYDVDAFFQQLARLCRGPLALFLSSGANMFSPRYVLKLIPVQWRAERRYRAERRAMITEMAPQLSTRDLARLARATQGLCRPDIEKTVAGFLASGSTREPPRSRTNRLNFLGLATCIPETGFWAEHYINPFVLRGILTQLGFDARVQLGYYHNPRRQWRSRLQAGVNVLIRGLGVLSLPVAPYYSIAARRSG